MVTLSDYPRIVVRRVSLMLKDRAKKLIVFTMEDGETVNIGTPREMFLQNVVIKRITERTGLKLRRRTPYEWTKIVVKLANELKFGNEV